MRSSAKMDMTTCTRITEYQASSIRLDLQNILEPSLGYRLRCLKRQRGAAFWSVLFNASILGFFVKKINVQYTVDQRGAINNSVLPEHAGILPGRKQVDCLPASRRQESSISISYAPVFSVRR